MIPIGIWSTTIPQNPQVRHEILKAAQTFLDDGDEQLRRRNAEIALIRQGLAEIAQAIAKLRLAALSPALSELRKYGYNPEEPRVPRGNPGPGRWTGESSPEAFNLQVAAAGWPRCEGFSAGCRNGGSYGSTAMFYIHGRPLCMDCAIKIVQIQNETGGEKMRILSPYYLDK